MKHHTYQNTKAPQTGLDESHLLIINMIGPYQQYKGQEIISQQILLRQLQNQNNILEKQNHKQGTTSKVFCLQ